MDFFDLNLVFPFPLIHCFLFIEKFSRLSFTAVSTPFLADDSINGETILL